MPAVKVPKSVKESLCIDQVHKNGIFKLEPFSGMAMYDQCYIFEDINYINKDGDKKTGTLLEFMKLLKSMKGQFKITIASEQQDMDAFMKEVFAPIHGEEYPLLYGGIGNWINQKNEEGTKDIRRTLLLTITCRARSFDEAGMYFATMDTTLQYIFASLRSRLYRMSGEERLALLQRMLRAGGYGIPPQNVSPDRDGWKNQILPASIVQDMDYLMLDRRPACVLFGHDYDQTLNEERVLHGLADTTFPTYITLDIEPVPKQLLKDKLKSSHMNNERSLGLELQTLNANGHYGAGPSYGLSKKKKELEAMMNQVDGNDEESVFLGLLVMVTADTLEELSQRVDTLCQIAAANGFTLSPYFHRQLKALNTVLPIGGRQVNHMRTLLTSSAVAFQPFYAHDLQEKGFVYGMDSTTKHLLRGDRKMLTAPHGIIVGHTGGGKSFLIKMTEIAQALLFTDDDIIILDPNNEQKEFITLIGGQYFDLTPQCEIHLNPFEVPERIFQGAKVEQNKFIAMKTEYAVSFCAATMRNMVVTQVHMNYIGRGVRKMYEDYFGQNSQGGKQQPTMRLLWELLKEQGNRAENQQEKRMILDICDCMEEYTIGVYDMFAHPSNLDIESRLVGFGLKNVPESVWEPAMLTIMHFLSMRIQYNQEDLTALRIVVDEAQHLCSKETSAAQLLYAVETYRKAGAVVTLAVQNLTRVLENESLRDIFSNCPYKCFLDQGGIDAANLIEIQELSEREFRALEENKPGHGVMVWGGQVYLFDAYMSKDNVLYQLLSTNFHEKAAEKRKQEGAAKIRS